MTRKLAVLFVHGVEIADPRFAETATGLLRAEFARIAGVDADEAVAVRTAQWSAVHEPRQHQLLDRVGGAPARTVFDVLDELAGRASRGSTPALLLAAASALVRALPWAPEFRYPTLRWLLVHYLGDAVAYQSGAVDTDLYDEVHAVLARALHELAAEAGPDAPLCVVAHSLGTVVTSDFFRDLQAAAGLQPRAASPGSAVTAELGDTPIERGETFAWFWSLGSPLALWSLRYPDFGDPVLCPHPDLGRDRPELGCRWVNVWDPDDVFAGPLKPLNEHYDAAVSEDREIEVGPWWLGWTPLSHPYYWNDLRVITPIASSLAQAWHRLAARAGHDGWEDHPGLSHPARRDQRAR